MSTLPQSISERRAAGAGRPETWVEEHGDYLFRYAMHRVAHVGIAEELVQETLLAALQSIDRYDGRAVVRTWLTSILRHKIADHFRHRPKEIVGGADDFERWCDAQFDDRGKWQTAPSRWSLLPANDVEHADLANALRGCLEKLPANIAELFVLREHHDVPPERLAAAIGITTGNLAVRLHRARLALRSCLDRHWFDRSPT